jgi:PadR family transcriptional regulator PadR
MAAMNETRISQFRKGVVELAILALLDAGELYGVEIVDTLGKDPALAISAGTVYPLLSRLKKGGLIDSVWRESPVGPPRKYYKLTKRGETELKMMAEEWSGVVESIQRLLEANGS